MMRLAFQPRRRVSRHAGHESWKRKTFKANLGDIENGDIGNKHPPPVSRTLSLRSRRMKEQSMKSILYHILVYLLYVIVLWAIAYNHRSWEMYGATETIRNAIYEEGFKTVESLEDFEDWATTNLVEELYPTTLYNGNETRWRDQRHQAFSRDYIRVIQPRVRQLRVRPAPCTVMNPYLKTLFQGCTLDYDLINEEKGAFHPGWELRNDTDNTTYLSQWTYTSASDRQGLSFLGQWNLYSGGGYVLELGDNRVGARNELEEAFRMGWLDKYTRAIFVEFTLYNANVNLFTVAHVLAEYREHGAMVTYMQLDHLNLYDYQTHTGKFRLFCEVVFVLFLVHQIIHISFAWKEKGRTFWKMKWNWVEFILVALGLLAVIMYGGKLLWKKYVIIDFLENRHNKEEKFNFYMVAVYDKAFMYTVSLIVFISTLKIFRFLSFNRKMHVIADTLTRAAASLWSFAAVFVIIYCAFAMLAHIWFGREHAEFASVFATIQTQFAVILGGGRMRLFSSYSIEAQFYYFAFTLTSLCITINMLLAILNEAFTEAKDELFTQPNQYEIVEYMTLLLQRVTGIKRRSQNDRDIVKASKREIKSEKDQSPTDGRRELRRFAKRCQEVDRLVLRMAKRGNVRLQQTQKRRK